MALYEPDPERAAEYGLSPRELEVLCLAAEGLNGPQIAERLGISANTVHGHLSRIMRKLGAESPIAAGARAVSLGILRD